MDRLIVDGYNIVYAWPELKKLLDVSLEIARERLIEKMSVYGNVSDTEVTVIFDAHQTAARNNNEQTIEGVRVIFTRKGHKADHAIERMAYEARTAGDSITVATSDRFQADLVRGMGGAVISATELERRVRGADEELDRRVKRYTKP
jgi:ribosomal protection tetracycline resistance protein